MLLGGGNFEVSAMWHIIKLWEVSEVTLRVQVRFSTVFLFFFGFSDSNMPRSLNMDEQVPRPFVLSALRSLRLYHIASILIAIVAAQIIYSILFHPLRNVPGPFFAKFTELWRTSRYLAGNWHYDICELHRKYGPVVRLSPNEVSFVDKEALTKLYGHSTGTKKV